MNNYESLCVIFKRVYYFESILSLLNWDKEVLMPQKNYKLRSEQIALINSIIHKELANPKVLDTINNLKEKDLSPIQRANLSLMHNKVTHTQAVPQKLIESFTKAYTECSIIWKDAKLKADFSIVSDQFTKVVKLARDIGKAKSDFLGIAPYDSFLDLYDMGRRSNELDITFNLLRNSIIELKSKLSVKNLAYKKIVVSDPEAIILDILYKLGFKREQGSFSRSAHPFSSGSGNDVRITVWKNDDNFIKLLYSAIHECGHAIYSQNTNLNSNILPTDMSLGSMIHESQAIFFEKQIGKSKSFIKFLSKYLSNSQYVKSDVSYENLYSQINCINNNDIRVYSDEVNYHLHIILRYKLEKLLINDDKFNPSELPDIWNEEFEKLFKRKPINDSQGCLQDIHWYKGDFGYFPFYSIASIVSNQIYNSLDKKINNLTSLIENGEFSSIKEKLYELIHSKGSSSVTSSKLLLDIFGSEFDTASYISYLNEKFSAKS